MSLDYSPLMPATPPPAARAEEAIEALETSALARDIPEFTTTLMRILDIPHALAARIASDASGEPMLAAAKAIGMPADVLQRIILFLNPVVGHSVQRVFALARLYDEINAEGALRLVTLWRAGKARRMPQPAHKPLFWDDGRTRPSARESAHPPARRYGARFGDIAEERRNFSARSGR